MKRLINTPKNCLIIIEIFWIISIFRLIRFLYRMMAAVFIRTCVTGLTSERLSIQMTQVYVDNG